MKIKTFKQLTWAERTDVVRRITWIIISIPFITILLRYSVNMLELWNILVQQSFNIGYSLEMKFMIVSIGLYISIRVFGLVVRVIRHALQKWVHI